MPKRKTTTSQPSSPKRQKHQPAHDASAEGPDTPGVPDVPDAPAVFPSPACPGQVRLRETGPLSPIVPESEIVEVFSKLREDKELSNEQALLEFLTKFNVSATTLSKAITGMCFSTIVMSIHIKLFITYALFYFILFHFILFYF